MPRPAETSEAQVGRWRVVYKPYVTNLNDNTLLVDTATGRTWFFDISQTHWWEIPRNSVEEAR